VERRPREPSDSRREDSVRWRPPICGRRVARHYERSLRERRRSDTGGVFGENDEFQVDAFVRPSEDTEAEIRVNGEWISGDKVYAVASD
jgi:hypothetical protein